MGGDKRDCAPLSAVGSGAHVEAGNPPGNGTPRHFEQINAFYCRCNHQAPARNNECH
jgi:hypothetical protein